LKVGELTFEEFLEARTLWNDTLQRSLDNNVFLTWEWLSNWWKFYGNDRRFLLITVSDGEKMVAAAPLMSSKYKLYGLGLRKIEFIGTPASDYHNFLLTDKEPEYVKMMVEYADSAEPEWDCIELQDVPEDSETTRALKTISGKQFRLKERMQNLCPCILLPNSFEEYLQSVGPNWRRNMRRWEKKLKKNYRIDFKVCNDAEAIADGMKILFDFHQKRWQLKKQPGAFADQNFRDFHLEVAKSFAERGWLTLNFLTLNDEPIAAGYAFNYGQKLFCYLSGFDPQYSEYEVGNLRHIYLIKYCIEKGLKEYDFLRGEESYKSLWNTVKRKNVEVRAIKRRMIPMFYDWVTKNEMFYPLTSMLGKHLLLR